jgi:hypothetical protein
MSIIDSYLALDLPLAVNRCLLMGRQLQISKGFISEPMPDPLKKQLLKFLSSIRKAARNYEAKQCYFNSQMVLASSLSSELKGRIEYCEGLYANERLPFAIPHAWNILDARYVVDTTMVNNVTAARSANLSDRFIGEFPSGHEYEGLCIESDFLIRRLEDEQESISVLDDYQARFPYMRELEQRLRKM